SMCNRIICGLTPFLALMRDSWTIKRPSHSPRLGAEERLPVPMACAFVVPLKTLNAGPNPKYFGTGRGITLVNYTSDQFSGFKNIVVTGTLRDSLVVLEGLLNQETGLQPRELMTDTASYSDVIFGLFHLLGYQFSPRLADVGEARFWRIDTSADYGVLNGLARQMINRTLIQENWDDILRVAGSLKLGTVNVTELLKALQAGGRLSTLARAIAELGRVAKTLYLYVMWNLENSHITCIMWTTSAFLL